MENAALEALLFASKQISGQNAFAVLLQDEALAVKFFAQLFQERCAGFFLRNGHQCLLTQANSL